MRILMDADACPSVDKIEAVAEKNGWWYSNANIDQLLKERHEVKKKRKSSKNHIKGPAKRTVEDEKRLKKCLMPVLHALIRLIVICCIVTLLPADSTSL